jgi:hypothetical protein
MINQGGVVSRFSASFVTWVVVVSAILLGVLAIAASAQT